VLHIATVHFGSPRWIEIQARHLRRHISVPYETWASLHEIDPAYGVHFDHVIDQLGPHPSKLNHLAMEIAHEADDDDLLMFLDGDAFPIADLMPLVDEGLAKAPLVAVRRAENAGDPQPHPCFCVTTVRTWRSLPGDWSMGYRWTASDGRRPSDVGANLLRQLELTNTPWTQVLRTNPESADPVFYAIYGDTIYHHGAGFRKGSSRAVYETRPKPLAASRGSLLRRLLWPIDAARLVIWKLRTRGPQISESNRLFEKIERDDADWLADVRSGRQSASATASR
jgi:hypothetical protein